MNGLLLIVSAVGALAAWWMLPSPVHVPAAVLILGEIISVGGWVWGKIRGTNAAGHKASVALFPLWMFLQSTPESLLSSARLTGRMLGGSDSFWTHVFALPFILLGAGIILLLLRSGGEADSFMRLPSLNFRKEKSTEKDSPWVDFYLGEGKEFDFSKMTKKEI